MSASDMSDGRLKPCLFCRRVEMLDTKFDEARFLKPFCWIVTCSGCGASGPNRGTEGAAIYEWNLPERQFSASETYNAEFSRRLNQ